MLNSRHQFMLATALATGLVVAAPLAIGQVRTPDSATLQADRKIPTPEESRAALMTPVSDQSSAGAATKTPASEPQTSGSGTPERAGAEPAASVGTSTSATPAATGQPSPSGPIGATGQTMPAKFSSRNDTLDRTPIMAWPQMLSDQERQRIYRAVMADKSQPAAGADALTPAGELSSDQALNGMHPLPASLGDIDAVKRLKYVKGKNKVLLIEPSTRIVVEQITS